MVSVSIGLPVYNGERYIAQAIDSILEQTFLEFELIISDNASTDRTKDICQDYASRDSRVRYYRNSRNLGAAYNYNRVFQLSNGAYFKWASHDDLCAPTYLECSFNCLENDQSIILCYPQSIIIDEHGNHIGSYDDQLNLTSDNPYRRLKKYWLRSAGECNAVFGLIRSSYLKKTSLIGPYNGSDIVLLTHLALLGKFCEIPEKLFFRRDHPETSGRANPTPTDVAAWFKPTKKVKRVFIRWRHTFEYLKCIIAANISFSDKVRCAGLVGRKMWWNKHQLLAEIRAAYTQTPSNR